MPNESKISQINQVNNDNASPGKYYSITIKKKSGSLKRKSRSFASAQYILWVHEHFPGRGFKTLYEENLVFDAVDSRGSQTSKPIQKRTFEGFEDVCFTFDENGNFEITEFNKSNSLSLWIDGNIFIRKPLVFGDYFHIYHAQNVENNSNIICKDQFLCEANKLINRGEILCEKFIYKKVGETFPLPVLDNKKGKIVATEKFILQADEWRNEGGLLNAKTGWIQLKNHLFNQKGILEFTEDGLISTNGNMHNEGGSILSKKGHLDLHSHNGKIVCTQRGRILSGNYISFINENVKNNMCVLRIDGQKIIIDDESIIRGEHRTEVVGSKICQESILQSKEILIRSDCQLDLNAGIIADNHLSIENKRQKLIIRKPLVSNKIVLEADHLFLQDVLYAYNAHLFSSGKIHYTMNSFSIRDLLIFSLQSPQNILSPIVLRGSFHLFINSTQPTHMEILAPITVGIKGKKRQSDFKLNAPLTTLSIGKQNGNYITLYSTGKTEMHCHEVSLKNGRVLGEQGIIVQAAEKISVGSLTKLDKERPSGFLSGNHLDIQAKRIIFERGDNQCYGDLKLTALEFIDNCASSLKVKGNAVINSPIFLHRIHIKKWNMADDIYLPRRQGGSPILTLNGEKALSEPPLVHISGTLTTSGKMEIFGSHLHHNGFFGNAPKQRSFIPFVQFYKTCIYVKRRSQQSSVIEYERPINAIFSSGVDLLLSNPCQEITGIVVAKSISLLNVANGCKIGLTLNISLSKGQCFKPKFSLMDYFKPSAAYEFTGSMNKPAIESLLPCSPSLIFSPPIISHSDGVLSENRANLGFLLSPDIEAEILVKGLMHELQRGFLDAKANTPFAMLQRFRENAYKLFQKYSKEWAITTVPFSKKDNHPLWYKNLKHPILVYTQTDFEGSLRLSPEVILPMSLDNPKTRDFAGGLFALKDINIEGDPSNNATLLITGHLNAKGKIKIKQFKTLTCEKRVYKESHSVTDQIVKKNIFGKRTHSFARTIEINQAQPGGTLQGGSVEIEAIETLNLKAADIKAGKEGIHINVGDIVESAIENSAASCHSFVAKNRLMSKAISQTTVARTIVPTLLESEADIHIVARNSLYLNSAQALAKSDLHLQAGKKLDLNATKVSESIPAQIINKKFQQTVLTGTRESGIPVQLSSQKGNIYCHSQGDIHSVGTQVAAKNGKINFIAEDSIIQKPLELSETRQSHASGIKGLKIYQSQNKENHGFGISPMLMSEQGIKMSAKKVDIVLVAPQFCTQGSLDLTAENGSVIIKPATFYHDITTQQHNFGFSFFGSEVVESLVQRDFSEAAKNLLQEFPLLSSVENLLNSKDKADIIGNGTHTLLNIYKTYKAFSQAKNLQSFLLENLSLKAKFRVGAEKQTHWIEELALPWMQARSINIVAKNIKSTGLQASCETFDGCATENIELQAASLQSKSSSTKEGVSLGGNSFKPSVGVDFSTMESRANEFLHSHLNVAEQFTLVAGRSISLKGIYVETCKAALTAESLHLESLQDRKSSYDQAMSASTDGQFSLHHGQCERKKTKEQTGIYAKETLIACIKKEINLVGASIASGGEGQTLTKEFKGEKFVFYKFALPEKMTLLDLLNLTQSDVQKIEQDPILQSIASLAFKTKEASFISQNLIQQISTIKIVPETKPYHTDCLILSVLAKLASITLRVWNAEKPLIINPSTSKTMDLLFDTKWFVLHTNPGFIFADKVLSKTVEDTVKQTSSGFNLSASSLGTVDLDYRNTFKQKLNLPTLSGNILVDASKVDPINRDVQQSRFTTHDKTEHYRFVAPLGNPKEIIEEMATIFTPKCSLPSKVQKMKSSLKDILTQNTQEEVYYQEELNHPEELNHQEVKASKESEAAFIPPIFSGEKDKQPPPPPPPSPPPPQPIPPASERRDAFFKAVYGEYRIPESAEAATVIGGVSGIAQDTADLAQGLAHGIKTTLYSTGLGGLVPEESQKQAKEKVRTFTRRVFHAATNLKETASNIRDRFKERLETCGAHFEKREFFEAGETIGPAVAAMHPTNISLLAKGTASIGKLVASQPKNLSDATKSLLQKGSDTFNNLTKLADNIQNGGHPNFAFAQGMGLGGLKADLPKPDILMMYKKRHEGKGILDSGALKNKVEIGIRKHTNHSNHHYHLPPEKDKLLGFPEAIILKSKTPTQGGNKKRTRWKLPDGKILEWDSRHGTLEMYSTNGKKHLGEFNPETGKKLRKGKKDRRIDKYL